jgi:hypothetical protein
VSVAGPGAKRDSKRDSARDSLPQVAVAIVIAVFVLLHAWEDSQKSFGVEFYQRWVVAQEMRASNAQQIYSEQWRRDIGQKYWLIGHSDRATNHQLVASDAKRTLETYSTPLVYWMIDVLSSPNYAHSLLIYRILEFTCGIAAIALICQLLNYSWTATILAITVLWGWGQAYQADIFAGDVGQIQLLLIAFVMWIEMRLRTHVGDYLAGMAIAKIVLLQPQLFSIPVLLGVIWLAARDPRRAVRHGIGFLVVAFSVLVFSSVRFGTPRCWIDWFAAAHALSIQHPQTVADNCSLAQIVREHLGSATSILFVGATRATIVILAGWFGHKGSDDAMKNYITISLACALPLLVWPIAWQADFVLAVPILLLAFQPATDSLRNLLPRWCIAAVALLMLCESQSVAARMAGATFVLFLLAMVRFHSEHSAHTISPSTISTAPASGLATAES